MRWAPGTTTDDWTSDTVEVRDVFVPARDEVAGGWLSAEFMTTRNYSQFRSTDAPLRKTCLSV